MTDNFSYCVDIHIAVDHGRNAGFPGIMGAFAFVDNLISAPDFFLYTILLVILFHDSGRKWTLILGEDPRARCT